MSTEIHFDIMCKNAFVWNQIFDDQAFLMTLLIIIIIGISLLTNSNGYLSEFADVYHLLLVDNVKKTHASSISEQHIVSFCTLLSISEIQVPLH